MYYGKYQRNAIMMYIVQLPRGFLAENTTWVAPTEIRDASQHPGTTITSHNRNPIPTYESLDITHNILTIINQQEAVSQVLHAIVPNPHGMVEYYNVLRRLQPSSVGVRKNQWSESDALGLSVGDPRLQGSHWPPHPASCETGSKPRLFYLDFSRHV